MKEESKQISLPLGDVSLNKKLGIYYIDMRPSRIHYIDNIYDGGFDANGVPMCGDGKGGFYYSTVNICQYGFIIHADYLEHRNEKDYQVLMACIEKLEETKSEDTNTVKWVNNYDNERYNIKAPWSSAMDSGEALSFYLRVYQLTNEEHLLSTTKKIYNFLKIDFSEGGVRRVDEKGYVWLEEYPSAPPSYVLNGFIYAVFGLYDLYRVTGNYEVKEDIDHYILTLKDNIHRFDSGYWSLYDLQKKELVRYYYQKNVHVPQLEILYLLSGEEIFKKYKIKWERSLTILNFLFVRFMYRIKPRFEKVYSAINRF